MHARRRRGFQLHARRPAARRADRLGRRQAVRPAHCLALLFAHAS